jgi:sugar/nucleoside kinase (ribokinase family)
LLCSAPADQSEAVSTRTRGVTAMDFPSDETRFASMLTESGMQVPPEQLPSLLEGYRHLLRLVTLLSAPAAIEAEPALTFAPGRR